MRSLAAARERHTLAIASLWFLAAAGAVLSAALTPDTATSGPDTLATAAVAALVALTALVGAAIVIGGEHA